MRIGSRKTKTQIPGAWNFGGVESLKLHQQIRSANVERGSPSLPGIL